jgi:uncharacterized protein
MSYYFLDSSALVKRYVPEQGTNWIRSIATPISGNTIFVAHITQVEIVSAVMRRSRSGSVAVRVAQAIRRLMERHASREYVVVTLADVIVERAKNLLEAHPLRAYDAVQLATSLEVNARLSAAGLNSLVFISADTRLLAVAGAEGLAIEDPNSHP